MRKLNTSDVFAMARVVRASGIRNELKPLLKKASEKGASAEDIGIEGLLIIMEALGERKAESAIYDALSGPMEVTAGEIQTMELEGFLTKAKELIAMNDMSNFFKSVSGILGKN